MINKDKIRKVDIYSSDDRHLLSTGKIQFPRDFFKIRGWELVTIKSNGLPVFHRGDSIYAIFEYTDGTRIKCDTRIDISTEYQLNFHVDEGTVLEERRNSFKVATPNTFAYIIRIERGEEIIDLEEEFKVRIMNINLTGVLMSCTMDLEPMTVITLKLLDGSIEMRTEVLRKQLNAIGEFTGYGCRFLDVSPSQEEKIARYIFDCQLAERERNRSRQG